MRLLVVALLVSIVFGYSMDQTASAATHPKPGGFGLFLEGEDGFREIERSSTHKADGGITFGSFPSRLILRPEPGWMNWERAVMDMRTRNAVIPKLVDRGNNSFDVTIPGGFKRNNRYALYFFPLKSLYFFFELR